MERWKTMEPERQEQIMGAALAEFGERGWDGASMQRIADGARLSKGLLYYYFEGREALFAWCLLQFLDELERFHGGWPALEDPATFWDDLHRFWDRITALAFERPEMMRALRTFLHDARSLDLGEPFAPLHERMDMFQARIVRQGQRLGLVRDDVPLELLTAMMGGVDEALDGWGFGVDEPNMARLRAANAHRVDFLRRLLTP